MSCPSIACTLLMLPPGRVRLPCTVLRSPLMCCTALLCLKTLCPLLRCLSHYCLYLDPLRCAAGGTSLGWTARWSSACARGWMPWCRAPSRCRSSGRCCASWACRAATCSRHGAPSLCDDAEGLACGRSVRGWAVTREAEGDVGPAALERVATLTCELLLYIS